MKNVFLAMSVFSTVSFAQTTVVVYSPQEKFTTVNAAKIFASLDAAKQTSTLNLKCLKSFSLNGKKIDLVIQLPGRPEQTISAEKGMWATTERSSSKRLLINSLSVTTPDEVDHVKTGTRVVEVTLSVGPFGEDFNTMWTSEFLAQKVNFGTAEEPDLGMALRPTADRILCD